MLNIYVLIVMLLRLGVEFLRALIHLLHADGTYLPSIVLRTRQGIVSNPMNYTLYHGYGAR